jgi:hypothetical protein
MLRQVTPALAKPALVTTALFPVVVIGVLFSQVVPVQEYKEHERSRESIELAYEAILQQNMHARHKYGFKPPRTGRKTDMAADQVSNVVWG